MVRLRVSSLQPQEITSEMLGLWADRRLCPHFHLPLQSGSDAVLKRMRRRYTADLYSRTVETIWQSIPDVSITADVIVGFPGETDTDFQQSYTVCERAGFADMHVFPYSVRPRHQRRPLRWPVIAGDQGGARAGVARADRAPVRPVQRTFPGEGALGTVGRAS